MYRCFMNDYFSEAVNAFNYLPFSVYKTFNIYVIYVYCNHTTPQISMHSYEIMLG